ncbi:MAG: hypothetical protein ABIA59_00780 [Candidatus Latescibacterota bacterium]
MDDGLTRRNQTILAKFFYTHAFDLAVTNLGGAQMKPFSSVLLFLFLCPLLCIIGCGNSATDPVKNSNNTSGGIPSLELIEISDCKDAPTGIPLSSASSSDLDCMEYWYGSGTLRMKHVNAGFNCCPVLDFAVHVDGNLITIEEIEIEGLCSCLCLFDVIYEIQDLAPAVYHLMVMEPYRPESDAALEFDMDLIGTTAGNYCVKRSQYPWGY